MSKSTVDRLNAKPNCTVGVDWKNFLLEHPWYPTRFLIKHFGIKAFDLDNWKRSHPEVREIIKNPEENFQFAKTSDQTVRALGKAWRFLFEEVLEIDFEKASSIEEVIKLQNVSRPPWGFICDADVFEKIEGYERWLAEGYTQIAFVVYHIYPGRNWTNRVGVLPWMFAQTGKKFSYDDLINCLEHIYIRFLCELPCHAPEAKLKRAKQDFYARAMEASFITTAKLARFGLTGHLAKEFGIKSLVRALKDKFGAELGKIDLARNAWNAARFRKENPSVSTKKCIYCGSKPVDLHHLLPRKAYPHLTYDSENVVPLCGSVHNAITRRAISESLQKKFGEAEALWRAAKKGQKTATFDDAMRQAHEEAHQHSSDA